MATPSGINALIPLSGDRINFGNAVTGAQNIELGRESVAQARMQTDATQQALADAERQAMQRARQMAEFESIVRGVKKLTPLLPNGVEDVPRFIGALDERIAEIESTGGNAEDTKHVKALAQRGDFAAIKREFDQVNQLAEQLRAQQLGVELPQQSSSAAPRVVGRNLVAPDGTVLFTSDEGEAMQKDRNGVLRFSEGPRQGQIVPGFDVEPQATPAEQRAQREEQRETEEREAAAETKQNEREFLRSTAQSLVDNFEMTSRVFGPLQGRVESVRPGTIDAEAQVDLLISNLSLENRQKMKGSGQVSDFESKLLGKSATLLDNKRISDDLAQRELQRIARIFSTGIQEAPGPAIQFLMQNKDNPEVRQQFEDKYGYLPDGV
jgi:hypothetical protein